MVADGMGGHAAGEVASKMAVEVIEVFINDTHDADVNTTWPFPYDTTLSLDGNRLKAAFRLANRRLGAAMEDNDHLRGMATTAAAVLLGEGIAGRRARRRQPCLSLARRTAAPGDAGPFVGERAGARRRAHRDRRATPSRGATSSHARSPAATIRRSRSARSRSRPAIGCSSARMDCPGVVPPERLEEIVGQNTSLQETCQALIDAANEAGGPDNITVAMLKVDVA